jgi:hypothetical protein
LATGDQVVPPLVEASQRTIGPTDPDKVSVPLFVPLHTLVTAGDKVPPSTSGVTVTVTVVNPAHPLLLYPVTVYVVVETGEAMTVSLVDVFKLDDGFQP